MWPLLEKASSLVSWNDPRSKSTIFFKQQQQRIILCKNELLHVMWPLLGKAGEALNAPLSSHSSPHLTSTTKQQIILFIKYLLFIITAHLTSPQQQTKYSMNRTNHTSSHYIVLKCKQMALLSTTKPPPLKQTILSSMNWI